MQYNLVHRDAVIRTFDTDEMDPLEVNEIKRLSGRYLRVERAVPDRLDPMPEGYDNLASVEAERAAWGKRGHYRTGRQNHANISLPL
jgi:hypothetical protein